MSLHVRRPSRRVFAAVLALACATLTWTAMAAAAQAKTNPTKPKPAKVTPSTPVTPGSGYLALGDSIPFGYMEPTVSPTPDYADPSSLVGYPEMVGSALDLKVTNAACPGETSSSMIKTSAPSFECENTPTPGGVVYRNLFPLHVKYTGSQLAYAIKYLKKHAGVRLVTLMVGANDLFVCQATTVDHCASQTEQLGVLATIQKNVHTIVSAIRDRAHYNGQLVIVDYYSLDYTSSADNLESVAGNHVLNLGAHGFHVRIANGFKAFELASAHSGESPCTAGLLTQLSTGGCGIHPSYAGQALLASAVEQKLKLG
jgi:lysophospholipase L1-like esterase